jgi:hypothetical protein
LTIPVVGYSRDSKEMFEDSKDNVVVQQIGEPAIHLEHDFQDTVPLN